MKAVINACYGGFGLPKDVCEKISIDPSDVFELSEDKTFRTNKDLIQIIEENPERFEELAIVDIPDEATDWVINEYDGLETVIAVVNGKIIYID